MTRTSDRRPGDSFALPLGWQLEAGPFDGRWGTQAARYIYMNAQCRYCGSGCSGPEHGVAAHPRALCLACGTPQCDTTGSCIVCITGYVGRAPFSVRSDGGTCGYAKCDEPAVAKAPRVKRVCLADLGRVATVRGAGRFRLTMADGIAVAVAQRELGGQSWQKLAWFGPARRYAVRRWHDDGRDGWTTGQHRAGFETAGQADREAGAWNDRRNTDGWHAERVLLTGEVHAAIQDWEGRAAGRSLTARLR